MSSESASASTPTAMLWTGYVLSIAPALLLLVDAAMKLAQVEMAVEMNAELGYPDSVLVWLGATLLVSVILYLAPQTAVLGAILLTGYLGGAVASHVRIGDGWSEILVPAIFGAVLWGGLVLRDGRLRNLLPWRTSPRQI